VQLLLTAVLIGALMTLVAVALKQRKPDAPTQTTYEPPQQLDRNDFVRPSAPWLVALFVSDTCHSCAGLVPKVEMMASEHVAVEVISFQADKPRHERYNIDSVPSLVLADAHGVVAKAFVGPVSATDLWAAMAELREPGSTPPPEAHRPA
jgi:Thioredoxin